MPIKRALLSVSDKTNIIDFGTALHHLGIELISTGGTASALREAGLTVRDISELTSFPEMMQGRLKTLHPLVHGGILNRRDNLEDRNSMADHNIVDIDLVVVNLYPFAQVIQDPTITWDVAVENIDIGGPTMLRAAAKNHKFVTVVCDPQDYASIIAKISDEGDIDYSYRQQLAIKTLRHTAYYDAQIANWLNLHSDSPELFPEQFSLGVLFHQSLRYGENPHQSAAVYRQLQPLKPSLLAAKQLQGKELSYNNYNDANAALELLLEFEQTVAVAVKHANPCGVAIGDTIAEAFEKCYDADPVSIYGGIIALNREVDVTCAELLAPIFLEVILAPSYSEEALAILAKKKNLRLLELGERQEWQDNGDLKLQSIRGGLLVQSPDLPNHDTVAWRNVTDIKAAENVYDDLLFAWKVVKHVRSNAIVIVKDGRTLGLGIGQVNRVDAVRHALRQAGDAAQDAVLASDAFFPFEDSIREAGITGIQAIIQPGGSVRDEESIQAANELKIAMIFTGKRHFRH